MMTTTPIENHTLERLLDAWDTTVLPTHRDGAMQEWMEALRHEFTTCPDASITGRITGRITGLDPAPKAETDDRHAQELLAQDITIARALLEQVLEALDNIPHPPWRDKELADAIRAELAKPVESAAPITLEQFRAIAHRTATTYRHRSDPEKSSYAFVDGSSLDDFWLKVCEAIPPAPAWHDAPEVSALKAERDELLKLINRRKIHPHDFPLEIFIADLSTRTANVLRAEFDSFRHTDGTYDIEPPFTVRHLLMFSRQEIKKWPGIGKKGLNEIEENLRARGLQLWHAHDDRSLRLLREHKSYFVDPAKAKGVAA